MRCCTGEGRGWRRPLDCEFSYLVVGLELSKPHVSFLNDVDRIARRNYEPTDDDVLRARLRTTGVQEHWFSTPSTSFTVG